MGMWEIIYLDGRRELAREPLGDPPARGDQVFIEQTTAIVSGGLFEVVAVRRVLAETGTPDSTERAIRGGPIDVVPRAAYISLKRLHP